MARSKGAGIFAGLTALGTSLGNAAFERAACDDAKAECSSACWSASCRNGCADTEVQCRANIVPDPPPGGTDLCSAMDMVWDEAKGLCVTPPMVGPPAADPPTAKPPSTGSGAKKTGGGGASPPKNGGGKAMHTIGPVAKGGDPIFNEALQRHLKDNVGYPALETDGKWGGCSHKALTGNGQFPLPDSADLATDFGIDRLGIPYSPDLFKYVAPDTKTCAKPATVAPGEPSAKIFDAAAFLATKLGISYNPAGICAARKQVWDPQLLSCMDAKAPPTPTTPAVKSFKQLVLKLFSPKKMTASVVKPGVRPVFTYTAPKTPPPKNLPPGATPEQVAAAQKYAVEQALLAQQQALKAGSANAQQNLKASGNGKLAVGVVLVLGLGAGAYFMLRQTPEQQAAANRRRYRRGRRMRCNCGE